jgi:hypothetical protein
MARNFLTNADHLDNATPAITAMPAAGLTLSAWVKFNTLALAQDVLTLGTAASNNNRWTLDMSVTNFVQAQARDGTAASLSNTSLAVTAGIWQLFTAVYFDDTNRASWLQGANKGTNAVLRTLVVPPANTRVSANPINNNPVTSGLVAHVAIWNIALTDSDILALTTNLPSSIQVSNLLDYWPITGASPEVSIGILGSSLTVTGTTFNSDDPYGLPPLLMGQAIF